MKITQLVATKKYTQYHESVANKLPRGIKTQQQLLNLGYSIAVNDLGLAKAKTLDENFAAKLVNSYHKQCIDEGIGSFLGKAAGNVVGAVQAAGRGIKNSWNDAKAGYAAGKGSWDDAPAGDTTAPAGGTAAPAGKTQLAGELEKSIASTPAPAATTPDELDAVKKNAGLPAAAPAGGTASPAAAAAPAGGTASPAAPAAAAPAAAAPTGKLTQAQQDAKKAELKGKRSAGKTTASQTGSGFKDYVGGSQTKLVGADNTGAPVFKKLNRESVGFSNFLDMDI